MDSTAQTTLVGYEIINEMQAAHEGSEIINEKWFSATFEIINKIGSTADT